MADKEYIERGAALLAITNTGCTAADVEALMKVPTADVVEVRHGYWVPLEYDGYADGYPVWDLWECSECQEEHSGDEDTLTPYCPNCGAKMEGGSDGQAT